MIDLRVLGASSLQAPDGVDVQAILTQPKRLALLAYLAIAARRGGVRRDTVLAFFWPELSTERARHALNQSIYHLRRALGSEVIRGNGDDQLTVDRALLRCDAVEFEDLLERNQHEAALEVYGGDLLPGLHVRDAQEFGEWLETTRARLHSLAVQCATALHDDGLRQDNTGAAIRAARRALELAPFDEPILRRLLETLEQTGDLAGALVAYESFADRCERELGAAPDPATNAIIDRIRSRGARLEKPLAVRVLASEQPLAAPPEQTVAPAVPARPRRTRVWLISTVLAVGALLLAAVLAANNDALLDAELIAIPPFRVLGASADSMLASGIPVLIELDLQSEDGPRTVDAAITARAWSAASTQRRMDPNDDLAREIARANGAGLVLQGTVLVKDNRMTLAGKLVDVRTGRVRGSHSEEGSRDQYLTLTHKLVTILVGTHLGEDPLRLERITSTSNEAVRLYLAGQAANRRGRFREAFKLLKQAVDIDSTFAAASLALVDIAGWSGHADLMPHYQDLTARHIHRLNAIDSAYARSLLINRSMGGNASSARARFEAGAAALRDQIDRPRALYQLGDFLFHRGHFLERREAARLARNYMERALAIDSTFTPAREHLIELGVKTNDAAAVTRYRDQVLAVEPNANRVTYLQWVAAAFLDNKAELRRLRTGFDTVSLGTLGSIIRTAQEDVLALEDAEAAARALLARAVTRDEHDNARAQAEGLLRNLGRLAAADSIRPFPEITQTSSIATLERVIRTALYTEYIPPQIEAAVDQLKRIVNLPATTVQERGWQIRALAALESWKLRNSDTTTAAASVTILRAFTDTSGVGALSSGDHEMRKVLIEAELEHNRLPRAVTRPRPALDRLDSLARAGFPQSSFANAALVRIAHEAGDAKRALAAARRPIAASGVVGEVVWLAPICLQEARLAAATGDREGALDAYRRYLQYRSNPDSLLRPQRDSAQAEYDALRRRR